MSGLKHHFKRIVVLRNCDPAAVVGFAYTWSYESFLIEIVHTARHYLFSIGRVNFSRRNIKKSTKQQLQIIFLYC
jgi:hypothetical protein